MGGEKKDHDLKESDTIRSLLSATQVGQRNISMFCGERCVGVIACFCDQLGISITGTPMLIHCYDLCFCCDSVKEFFDIVTEYRTAVERELLYIPKEYNVVQGQIINRFAFAVCRYIG